MCSRCNLDVHESVMHVLRDCPYLGDFWLHLVRPSDWASFFIAHTHLWLASNLKGGHILAGSNWPQIFGSAMHFLWRSRNEEIFENIVLSPDELFSKFWAIFHGNWVATDFTDSHCLSNFRRVILPGSFPWKVGLK